METRLAVLIAIVVIAISSGILVYYYSQSITNRTNTIASINTSMNSSNTRNATLVPPTDEVSLQILSSEISNGTSGNYDLPIHVVHKVNLNATKNGFISIFPILPEWKYDKANNPEKEYFILQDDKGRNVSPANFFYREGMYSPTVICEPTGENETTPQRVESKIAFPMAIPIKNENISGNYTSGQGVLFAKYNLYGLSPVTTNNNSTGDDGKPGSNNSESANLASMKYNLTFSSFNNVQIQIPNEAKELSHVERSCITTTDNPVFPSWHVNIYTVIFEIDRNTLKIPS